MRTTVGGGGKGNESGKTGLGPSKTAGNLREMERERGRGREGERERGRGKLQRSKKFWS